MPTRPSALAVLAAAALATGLVPASASATPPSDPPGQTKSTDTSTPPVVTGRPDGGSNGRKN